MGRVGMKTKGRSPKASLENINQKRDVSRSKILEAAMELFYVQGYSKTTTRQIIQKTGILNGSLYHSFTNKEDIFKTIIIQALTESLEESEKLFRKCDSIPDLITVAAFPVALELYAASLSKRAAELLYQAHQSWTVLDSFINVYIEWVSSHTTLFDPKEHKREFYVNTLAVMGSIGNLVGEFCNTDQKPDYRDSFKIGLEIFCAVFKYPAFTIESIAEDVCNMIESNNVQIFKKLCIDNEIAVENHA